MTHHYKFIADPEAARFLLKGIVKFTPISELNDPSELTPSVVTEDMAASLSRLRSDGYTEEDLVYLQKQGKLLQRLAPQFQAISAPHTKEQATQLIRSYFYDAIPFLEEMLARTAQEISSKVGLFCLSLRYDSLPMWAHYANNAAGLVIEFTNLEQEFTGDETGVLRKLVPVVYERERLGVTFEPRSHESLFFAKFQDWAYEKEVRVVLPLADCQQEKIAEKLFYLHTIPRTCVSRIILGWNMPGNQAETVRSHARTLNPQVEVVQSRFIRGRITLTSAAQQAHARDRRHDGC